MSGNDTDLPGRLGDLIGPEHVLGGDRTQAYAVEGVPPQAVVFPGAVEEVGRILAFANQRSFTLFPRGGGTQTGLGGVPERVDIVLSLSRLNQLVAHEPADMTVTVQAGMALSDLQALLCASGQFLPFDPPLPAAATVGGSLATRSGGPLRFGFRSLADRLLGTTVVTATGETAKAGGRVVKNVSGYELGRLYTGSLGTLAVIVEATLKVQPRFAWWETLIVGFDDLRPMKEAVAAILDSDAIPAMMEAIGPISGVDAFLEGDADFDATLMAHSRGATTGDAVLLVLGYAGTQEGVAWQLAEAERVLGDLSGIPSKSRASSSMRRAWESVYPALLSAHRMDAHPSILQPESRLGSGGKELENNGSENKELETERSATKNKGGPAPVVCRAHVLGSEFVDYLSAAVQAASTHDVTQRYAAHAGSGIARLHLCPNDGDTTRIAPLIQELRKRAKAARGHLILESAPPDVKEEVGVWGDPGDDFFLHRAVKERMDANRILNPGRFIGNL